RASSRTMRSSIPTPVRLKTKLSPVGRTARSRRSFETSMPTTIASNPCANGLRKRPKRLFGFDGTAGDDTRSLTGSAAHGFCGLSPATAPPTISEARDVKLQGFLAHRSHSRSEDETEIRAGEGAGGKDCEGHPPHDAAEILGRRKDPYRAGGPARRGEHRRALPPCAQPFQQRAQSF